VKSRPDAQYKVHKTTVDLYGIPYRAVVVHSDSHVIRRQKKLEKQIACSADTIAKTLKQVQKIYFCEADARKASSQAEKLSDPLHRVSVMIEPVEVPQRGRPSRNNPATDTRYQLSWQLIEETEGIQHERDLAGCFVLITNVPAAGELSLDSAGVLRTYKGQNSIESDFAFLKDPLVVNDLFLKTPSRIDALGEKGAVSKATQDSLKIARNSLISQKAKQLAVHWTANFAKLWAIQSKPHSVFTLSNPPESKSSEAPVLFNPSEHGLHLHSPT
jgi:transposase